MGPYIPLGLNFEGQRLFSEVKLFKYYGNSKHYSQVLTGKNDIMRKESWENKVEEYVHLLLTHIFISGNGPARDFLKAFLTI